jgi:hypothetical protein
MELARKDKVIAVLVLTGLSLLGIVLAFMFIYLDLFLPSNPAFDINAPFENLVPRLEDVTLKLEEVVPEIEKLVNYAVSQIPDVGIINSGPLIPFDTNKCLEGEADSCFFQNPATPYTRFAWENELPGLLSTLDVIPFQPRDVIVIRGITPPACAYWSFIPYLLRGTGVCSGETVAAGLSDSVSNITTGWEPSTPFAILMGSNSAAISYVKSKLSELTEAPSQVATQQFAYVGKGLYWIIGRTTLFESDEEKQAYLADTRISAVIARVPEESFEPAFTLTEATYKPRNTDIDENEVIGTDVYEAQADDYLQSVLDTLGRSYTAQEVPVIQVPELPSGGYDSGASCIAECGNCFIDNRDTVYFAGEVSNLSPGYYLLIYAVNHSAYNKAIYAQISVYDNSKELGLDSVERLPRDGDFYKVLITQTTDAPTEFLPDTEVLFIDDEVTDVSVAERSYVQPTTSDNPSFGLSADPRTLLPMKVWLLSP